MFCLVNFFLTDDPKLFDVFRGTMLSIKSLIF